MNKHFLVTISEQNSALFGVKFLGHFFKNKKNIKITLYYTYPRSTATWDDATHKSQMKKQQKQFEEKGRLALENAKQACFQLGFMNDQIEFKLEIRKTSKVTDILNEGAKGLYDAVVLGRRGASWLEEAFEESVTKNILKENFNFPIWLCKKSEADRKNILLCVDGKEPSFRMTDHVGFVLGEENQHEVTLFLAGENSGQAEDIFRKAKGNLLKNSLPEAQVKTKIVSDKNVANAIISEVKKRNYAAVAVGRRKSGQNTTKKLFLDSVSTRLYKDIEGASLWISY